MADWIRKKCIVCNKEFVTNRKKKKACDNKCSKKNWRNNNYGYNTALRNGKEKSIIYRGSLDTV